jgi:acyl-CoA reductase-like NAD-dependent aldehyde dehydrogenase
MSISRSASTKVPTCIRVPANCRRKGFFCKPTLFLNTSQSHRVVQEEIFGPVLAVQTFRTVEEAIEKANNIPFGLSAGVWTDKGSKIFNLTTKMRAGVVWANTYNKFDPTSPFGGYKESGFGREGGLHGLLPYVRLQELESIMSRIEVLKTYKIFIGGQFPRTESGRYYALTNKKNEPVANVSLSSRKDFRNAVVAARNAAGGWSSRRGVQSRTDPLPHRRDAGRTEGSIHR